MRERFPIFGSLVFWLCLILASACTIIALSRPTAAAALVRTAGIDLVVLQDGSASMRTEDVAGNRWQRSMRFLRVLGESLAWKDDRMAMALFAHIAAPQVRLTKDPNTFFFFLDHLAQESPFRLEDDTTWDTNIELGIAWGMRLIETRHGAVRQVAEREGVRAGHRRSGVERRGGARAEDRPHQRRPGVRRRRRHDRRRIHPRAAAQAGRQRRRSNRRFARRSIAPSLAQIATAGGGEYLELDREGDREIANQIIDAARKRAGSRGLRGRERRALLALPAARRRR